MVVGIISGCVLAGAIFIIVKKRRALGDGYGEKPEKSSSMWANLKLSIGKSMSFMWGSISEDDDAEEGCELPEGWTQFTDKSTGRQYYYNVKTKQTTWSRPKAPRIKTKKSSDGEEVAKIADTKTALGQSSESHVSVELVVAATPSPDGARKTAKSLLCDNKVRVIIFKRKCNICVRCARAQCILMIN